MYYNTEQRQPPFEDQIVFTPEYGYISRKKLAKKDISRITGGLSLTLIFFFVASVVGTLLLFLIGFIAYTANSNYDYYTSLDVLYSFTAVTTFLGLGLPFLIYMRRKNERFSDILLFKKAKSNAFLYVLAGAGMGFFLNIPAYWIMDLLDDNGLNLDTPEFTAPTDLLGSFFYILAVAVVPSLVEELVLRGVVLTKLRRFGDVFAIVFSAFLFGILHISVVSIFVTMIMGIMIGYIYVKTSNLWYAVAVHFINNFTACVLSMLSAHLGVDNPLNIVLNNAIFYGLILLGLISLIILIATKQIKLPKNQKYRFLKTGDKISAAIFNPSTIILLIICTGMAIYVTQISQ